MKRYILIALLLMFLSGSGLALAGDDEPYNVSFDYPIPTMTWYQFTSNTVEAGFIVDGVVRWHPTAKFSNNQYAVPMGGLVSCTKGVYIRSGSATWGPYDCLTRVYLPLIVQ